MDPEDIYNPTCPFCPFSDQDDTFVAEHIEYCHPEGVVGQSETPCSELAADKYQSATRDQQSQILNCDDTYIECPRGCGEVLETAELSTHLDLHIAEEIAFGDNSSIQPRSHDTVGRIPDFGYSQSKLCVDDDKACEGLDDLSVTHRSLKQSFSPGSSPRRGSGRNQSLSAADTVVTVPGGVKRLGRAELGPHAHEKRMPSWLRKLLEQGAKKTQSNIISPNGALLRREILENEATNVIPVLARLCKQDKSVQRAFLCYPKVRQITKMPREGGFCGYRNIQMLISYIQESRTPGHEHFPNALPTILQLQDMIEHAWDMGFNSLGRVETGGIRGTRKYIGTPEAQALFLSLGIQCEAESIGEAKELRAHDALYAAIAAYFRQACPLDENEKVFVTSLPPIYLQHQGHSLTIVGFEIHDNGSANLLVFDPMFKTPPAVKRLNEPGTVTSADPTKTLKVYRRGTAYLQKYKVFEILKLPVTESLPMK